MAHMNKYLVVGRMTRDPDAPRTTRNGRMISFGLAVGKGKKNAETGQWEDGKTLFWDVTFFGGDKTDWLIDRITENGRKGAEVLVEGELEPDEWVDKQTGDKRSKIKFIARDVQFLNRQDSDGGQQQRPQQQARQPVANGYGGGGDDYFK